MKTIISRIRKEKEDALLAISKEKASLHEEMEKYELDANTVSNVKAKTDSHEVSLNKLANRMKQTEEDVEMLKV